QIPGASGEGVPHGRRPPGSRCLGSARPPVQGTPADEIPGAAASAPGPPIPPGRTAWSGNRPRPDPALPPCLRAVT
ncbi:Helix-turn-helix domain-containing protein, partial [Dysosmobacter welbionis]